MSDDPRVGIPVRLFKTGETIVVYENEFLGAEEVFYALETTPVARLHRRGSAPVEVYGSARKLVQQMKDLQVERARKGGQQFVKRARKNSQATN